jgi:hypothetical protein
MINKSTKVDVQKIYKDTNVTTMHTRNNELLNKWDNLSWVFCPMEGQNPTIDSASLRLSMTDFIQEWKE